MKHICEISKTCECSTTALEPDENCPIHGLGHFPPRCCICGRFMKWGFEPYKTNEQGEIEE
jgi:hypothetical protein